MWSLLKLTSLQDTTVCRKVGRNSNGFGFSVVFDTVIFISRPINKWPLCPLVPCPLGMGCKRELHMNKINNWRWSIYSSPCRGTMYGCNVPSGFYRNIKVDINRKSITICTHRLWLLPSSLRSVLIYIFPGSAEPRGRKR